MYSSLPSGRNPPVIGRHLCLAAWSQPPETIFLRTSVTLLLTREAIECGKHGVFVLITRELEHAVLAQSPKISNVAFLPTTVWPWCVCVCVRGIVSSVPSLASWSPAPVSRSPLWTYTPPAVLGICLLMRQQPVDASSQCSNKRVAVGRVGDMASSISSHAYPSLISWSLESTSMSSLLTCAPPLMSGLCLLMIPAEHGVYLEWLTTLHGWAAAADHGTP